MTQEEKARAYDEALERAQKATRAGSDVAMDIVQYIFPQLAESEDERIRKALVWHLKADVDFVSNGVTKAECLAYLEKQKSQKPWEWSEEETKVLDSIIDDYEKAAKSFCGYDGKIGLLRAIRNGEYDLSKQEWNDGKNILEDIIVFVSGYADKRVVTKWVSFLKSLRPQPRQAWSEEDERMRKGLINFLRSSFIKENITDEMVAPWIAYLERQKPFVTIPATEIVKNEPMEMPSGKSLDALAGVVQAKDWKPSEVQMKYLLMLADYFESEGGTSNAKTLRELYENLKKL